MSTEPPRRPVTDPEHQALSRAAHWHADQGFAVMSPSLGTVFELSGHDTGSGSSRCGPLLRRTSLTAVDTA